MGGSSDRSVAADDNVWFFPRYKSTPPKFLFALFVMLNLITMIDRGILPGSSSKFAAFVGLAGDTPAVFKRNPDAALGLLQAAYIVGYTVAILISSHMAHTRKWKNLISVGMSVWFLAVIGSGLSFAASSFYLLLFSRIVTGVAEASFHVVAPPIIQDRGGAHSGFYLSIYLAAMPVGLSTGYVYGFFLGDNENLGWQWAYFFLAIASAPIILACFFVRDSANGGILPGGTLVHKETVLHKDGKPGKLHQMTYWDEIAVCLSSPVLIYTILGYSVMIAVVSVLGTFGGAFVLALELFDDEKTASLFFGFAAACAGIIGMPIGGLIADRVLEKHGGGNRDEASFRILPPMLTAVNMCVIASILSCWPTTITSNPGLFLLFLFFGWTFLFMAQSGVAFSIMMSVPSIYRPNALACSALLSHALGDVPAPIIFGALKDQMAPACIISPDGEFQDPDECRTQHKGVRVTLAVMFAYMSFAALFFELARRGAQSQLSKKSHEQKGDADSLFDPVEGGLT
eukprot:CAMPEP_0198294724 /NCGR_PEP_ID=MMETSP1449-20131203/23921_1 /TAXON_ID=420275 /ORGANISM="Attheya septentrionalis, Strain CCMP2084" /LENGTH=513 /DNA_ID=CAMNT_0043994769 /DNA_START=54 /DNA_END=1595 /DNA_ORIENTATION=-